MAYIGRPSIVGNFVKLDSITAVNGQAAYTMQNNSVNFTDYSTVNQFLVSLNSVIQSPGSSFTVSGSTLTFSSNLSTGDVIDFIIVFGNSLSAGVPTDGTVSTAKIVDDAVTAAKINNDIISGSTELATEPADTDEFLVSDAGTLKRIDYSLIKGGGITMAQQWRLTANKTSNGVLDANLEVVDTAGYGTLGTGMSESSGIFTFPSTGIYMVIVNATFRGNSENSMSVFFDVTTNNSSYNTIAAADNGQRNGTDTNVGAGCSSIIDVTDTSNVKVRFQSSSIASGSYVYGNTDTNNTSFMFVRLGDT